MKYSVLLLAVVLFSSNADNEHIKSHHITVDGNNLPSKFTDFFDCSTCDPTQIESSVNNPTTNRLSVYYVPPANLNNCDINCIFEVVCDKECYDALYSKIGHVEHGNKMETDIVLTFLVAGTPDVHKLHVEVVEACDPDDNDENQDPTIAYP